MPLITLIVNSAKQSENIQKHLSTVRPIFKFMPVSLTAVSTFLRLSTVQCFISMHVVSLIQQSFPDSFLGCSSDAKVLNEISDRLSSFSRRKAAVWRTLTLQSLKREPVTSSPSSPPQAEKTVTVIFNAIRVLVPESQRPSLEESLLGIVEAVVEFREELWNDSCRIIIQSEPDVKDKEGWRVDSDPTIENPSALKDMSADILKSCAREVQSLCLFPRIVGVFEGDDGKDNDEVLNPGRALFADSQAFALGLQEQIEMQEDINGPRNMTLSRFTPRKSVSSSQDLHLNWPGKSVSYN